MFAQMSLCTRFVYWCLQKWACAQDLSFCHILATLSDSPDRYAKMVWGSQKSLGAYLPTVGRLRCWCKCNLLFINHDSVYRWKQNQLFWNYILMLFIHGDSYARYRNVKHIKYKFSITLSIILVLVFRLSNSFVIKNHFKLPNNWLELQSPIRFVTDFLWERLYQEIVAFWI